MSWDVEINLDEFVIEVGEYVTGVLTRLPDSDGSKKSKVRSVSVEMRYTTSGTGDRDTKAVATKQFPCDEFGAVHAPFRLAIPFSAPISYDGQMMRVSWQLVARKDIKLQPDSAQEYSVLVVPKNGFSHYDRPHPLA